MNILEKEIEEIIAKADLESLERSGLKLRLNTIIQPNLSPYGIADLICYEADKDLSTGITTLYLQVIEIKKEKIDIYTLLQASKYAKALRAIMSDKRFDEFKIVTEILLVGKKIDYSNNFIDLVEFIDNVSVFTYSIDMTDGIKFTKYIAPPLNNNICPFLKNLLYPELVMNSLIG
jgi:hypothetical protein